MRIRLVVDGDVGIGIGIGFLCREGVGDGEGEGRVCRAGAGSEVCQCVGVVGGCECLSELFVRWDDLI